MTGDVRVLIVEDEPLTAEAHAAYVSRLEGFTVVGSAANGRAMLAAVAAERPDLVLLDFNLPDAHGLELVRELRAAGSAVDVIAVTAAHDARGVRNAIALGIVQYLVKPFSYRTFAERLTTYRDFRSGFEDRRSLTQADIDKRLSALRPAMPAELTKGIARETLELIQTVLIGSPCGASASEVAAATGISRVTARRYLEYLITSGQVERDVRYAGPGRPEYEYQWLR
ncbi:MULTISPECIES: response regulator [Curtobacterium]|uniref:Transcriptional regulatory protein n=2 Tax=Curtobacterium TaxID=2034 RepID=A0A6G7GB86_9MICO|nr:response regulator [Curtobacterium flaccumfaciens]MBO9041499.1 response regulator [Curtobacterium flaccumfaciens pv. flaccumfaciens]MBO9044985.1 response regulator [Curtobacterium flaccumfaciens pv. flaccumfaciens]MBO9048873.1 response regulator [Curtobacterium flaccumfaciens pv. flaccumfaciens]MBO9057723.1 response regulator [Curtobacterium flaccumfaciens pv. flaccumfaciens]MBT1543162.1 response regulator [Curtobacterium flaccumfaciens pv. flaccumfaciens]